jgi:ribosomal protein S18 acetylase RimI-like enzyme
LTAADRGERVISVERLRQAPEDILAAVVADSVADGVSFVRRLVDEWSTGRVRHLYVLTTHRRLGIGARLVREVVTAARGRFDRLHLRTRNDAAAALYERLGFRARRDDPHCTHVMDVEGDASGAMQISQVIRQPGP